MKEHFEFLLNDYQEAYGQQFAKHPIVDLVKNLIPNAITESILEKERFLVKGSAGAGNWTATPWIAIFDILITNTAQSGYYPVFLFRDDMSGFYLSLNQGVTEIKEKYKKEAKQVLKIKADDYRAQLSSIPINFNKLNIILKTNKKVKSNLSTLYEAGNIIAKFYSAYNVPEEGVLRADIAEILRIYEHISYNEGLPSNIAEIENDEEKFKGFEDLKRFRFHKRIERNIQLSKIVKKVQGYTCKACGLNFKDKYGELGEKYIEAHHLIPISKLTGSKIRLDARTDFTVYVLIVTV